MWNKFVSIASNYTPQLFVIKHIYMRTYIVYALRHHNHRRTIHFLRYIYTHRRWHHSSRQPSPQRPANIVSTHLHSFWTTLHMCDVCSCAYSLMAAQRIPGFINQLIASARPLNTRVDASSESIHKMHSAFFGIYGGGREEKKLYTQQTQVWVTTSLRHGGRFRVIGPLKSISCIAHMDVCSWCVHIVSCSAWAPKIWISPSLRVTLIYLVRVEFILWQPICFWYFFSRFVLIQSVMCLVIWKKITTHNWLILAEMRREYVFMFVCAVISCYDHQEH